jgi:hypothetical protein
METGVLSMLDFLVTFSVAIAALLAVQAMDIERESPRRIKSLTVRRPVPDFNGARTAR